MKYFLISIALFLMSCSPGSSDRYTENDYDDKSVYADNFSGSPEQTLAHMLSREAGVRVTEKGGSYSVTIRGVHSINNPTPPLYVVNGTSIGHDFNTAAQSIAGAKIQKIRVLKDQETSFYGIRGTGGVIEITTVN